jgi:hypothetical protein
MARSRRTPAMLVGRCYSELSGHKLYGKLKKSQAPGKPTCPALPRLAVGRAVEGSAVPRTSLGNAEYYAQTERSSRLAPHAVGSAVFF